MASGAQLVIGSADAPRSAEGFVDGLYDRMLKRAEQKVGQGRFMSALAEGRLPMSTLQLFWLNWHQHVRVINNFLQVVYHLHYPFFLRHGLDLLPSFADKVADEIIHPTAPGHMLVVWRQGEIFGLTRDQMINYEMLPGCRPYVDYRCSLMHEGTMAEWWASITTETYIGHWAAAFRRGMHKLGFSDEQLPYFTVHEEADLEVHEGGVLPHGLFNREVLIRLLSTGHDQTRPGYSVEYCAMTAVDLLAMFLDTCFQEGAAR